MCKWLAVFAALAVVACEGSTRSGRHEDAEPGPAARPDAAGITNRDGGSNGAGQGLVGDSGAGNGGAPSNGGVSGSGGVPGNGGAPSNGGASGNGGGPGNGGAPGDSGVNQDPVTPVEQIDEGDSIECCVSELDCSSASFDPTCRRLPEGRWECSCAIPGQTRIFQTDEPTGAEACSVAGGVCSLAELSLDEEICESATQASTASDCDGEVSCEQRISTPFAPGVGAWVVRSASVLCGPSEILGLSDCSCRTPERAQSYTLDAQSLTSGCEALLDVCVASTRPAIDGPTACYAIDSAMTELFCRSTEWCGASLELGSGVSIVELTNALEWECDPGSPAPRCNCWTPDTALSFLARGATTSVPTAETCNTAARVCREGLVATASGEPSCEVAGESAANNACTADLACLVPAILDDQDVTIEGKLGVECRRASPDDPWSCSCASNSNGITFELGSTGVDASDACAAAPPRCLELMDVSLQPYARP